MTMRFLSYLKQTLLLAVLLAPALPMGAAVPWQNVEPEVEIKMRIPLDQVDEFKKLHSELFKKPRYDWRAEPKGGHYYPYNRYLKDKPYPKNQPSYLTDNYYSSYHQAGQKSAVQNSPTPPKEMPGAPRDGQSYYQDELRFEKIGEVYFNDSRTTLTGKARYRLSQLAEKLKNRKFKYINIRGYTDVRGKKSKNHRLGLARARRVAEFLEDLGVDLSKAYIGSGGESFARSPMKLNRRAEIVAFFTPLPVNQAMTFETDKSAYSHESRIPLFFIFVVVFLFVGILGVAFYVTSAR